MFRFLLGEVLELELEPEAAATCCMYWARAACWARAWVLEADCEAAEAVMAACSCWMAAVCPIRVWNAEYCSDSPVRYSCIRLTDPELSLGSGVLEMMMDDLLFYEY